MFYVFRTRDDSLWGAAKNDDGELLFLRNPFSESSDYSKGFRSIQLLYKGLQEPVWFAKIPTNNNPKQYFEDLRQRALRKSAALVPYQNPEEFWEQNVQEFI